LLFFGLTGSPLPEKSLCGSFCKFYWIDMFLPHLLLERVDGDEKGSHHPK